MVKGIVIFTLFSSACYAQDFSYEKFEEEVREARRFADEKNGRTNQAQLSSFLNKNANVEFATKNRRAGAVSQDLSEEPTDPVGENKKRVNDRAEEDRVVDASVIPVEEVVVSQGRPASVRDQTSPHVNGAGSGTLLSTNKGTVTSALSSTPKKQQDSKHIYIAPPVLKTSKNHSVFNATKGDRPFGVPVNTWVVVSLVRNITNADIGTVELVLDRDILGEFDTLPAGTVFISKPFFNEGTRRLDLVAIGGRTPDGREFELKAVAYDMGGRSGIAGVLLRDRRDEINEAVTDSVVDLGKGALQLATPNSLLGQAVGDTGEALISNENQARRQPEKGIILVSSQQIKLKVEQAF
ncbi:MAG: hypothetical protein OQK73_00125 [Gammaproteobacteria bacterium]|nr:hypothetical protein [Gammaproteobacteria bacterium]